MPGLNLSTDIVNSQPENYIAELVQLCSQGDTKAFSRLYEHLNQKIFGFLVSRLPERVDAMDIMQDIFLDLWQALTRFTYKSDKQFYSFVFIIAKRKISKFYHNRKLTVEFSDEYVQGNYTTAPVEINNLMQLVNKLKQKYQDVVRLRYWSEMSFSEIGNYLGIGESAAKVRHHRALKQLQSIAKEYEG
jgi:RNA polymerase sigma-70 factor (ECF subfamily)